jgi:hypothetical protein
VLISCSWALISPGKEKWFLSIACLCMYWCVPISEQALRGCLSSIQALVQKAPRGLRIYNLSCRFFLFCTSIPMNFNNASSLYTMLQSLWNSRVLVDSAHPEAPKPIEQKNRSILSEILHAFIHDFPYLSCSSSNLTAVLFGLIEASLNYRAEGILKH